MGTSLFLPSTRPASEPAGVDDVDLQALLEIDGGPAAAGTEQGERQDGDQGTG